MLHCRSIVRMMKNEIVKKCLTRQTDVS
jgi:hypothetical protein